MRNVLAVSWLAFLLGGVAIGSASATTLDLTGTCYSDCSNLGLVDGDAIGGTITVDDAYYSQGGSSGNEALLSYAFSFGDFSLTSADKPDPDFYIGWENAPGSVFNVSLGTFLSDDPSSLAPALAILAFSDFDGNGWATLDGYSREIPDCCTESGLGHVAQLVLDPIGVTPIPLPAAGWLLAGALLAVGAARRSGRQRRPLLNPSGRAGSPHVRSRLTGGDAGEAGALFFSWPKSGRRPASCHTG